MSHVQDLLVKELYERKQKNPLFSLRAFARQLKISPAQLSLLINGKKKLTVSVAEKIVERLNLSSTEIMELVENSNPLSRKYTIPRLEPKTLSDEEFNFISDWVHFAILELAALKSNNASSRWISNELGIDSTRALDAVSRLQRLGLINTVNGRLKRTAKAVTTTSDIPSGAIRKYHKQNLELAREKIDTIPVEYREYSSVTTSVSLKKLPKVKKLIYEFRRRINEELEGDDATEVYTLAIQLFPLTKVENRTKSKDLK